MPRKSLSTLILAMSSLGCFLVTLSGSYLWSCSVVVLQHFGFQLEKSDSILKTTEGLLTKRRIENSSYKDTDY